MAIVGNLILKQILTLIGIATNAVERNPRENTDAIPLNRRIERCMTWGWGWLPFLLQLYQFPLFRLPQNEEAVEESSELSSAVQSMLGRRWHEPAIQSAAEMKHGGHRGKAEFWRPVYKMRANGIRRKQNWKLLKNRFSSTVLHIPFYFLYVCLFIIAEFALSECTGYAYFSLIISAHFWLIISLFFLRVLLQEKFIHNS